MNLAANEPLTLLEKVERLHLILRARATGGMADNEEFRRLRREVVSTPALAVPRFLRVCRSLDEFWEFIQPKFPNYAGRRAYLQQEFAPLLQELEERQHGRTTPVPQSEGWTEFDSVHVRQAWETALDRMKADPDGAVTAAKTLLESVCKHILDEEGVPYSERDDLPGLYSKVAQQLSISPNQQVDETIRRLMGAAQQVVERVGTLRNLVGDAHGRGKNSPQPEPHHAELAVNLAGSLVTFLIAAWEAGKAKASG